MERPEIGKTYFVAATRSGVPMTLAGAASAVGTVVVAVCVVVLGKYFLSELLNVSVTNCSLEAIIVTAIGWGDSSVVVAAILVGRSGSQDLP